MVFRLKEVTIITESQNQLIDITEEVEEYVNECKIEEGFVHVMTRHTTTGLLVNEGFEDVEETILDHMEHLAPEDGDYQHNRFLMQDGCLGYNANAHIKSVILGYFLYFPINSGRMLRGSRQTLYFAELDGPKTRKFIVQVAGTDSKHS